MSNFRLDDFLGCFFHEGELINIRGLNAKGWSGPIDTYTRSLTREQIRTNEFIQMDLKEANEKHGMYFVVNSGGFLKSDITRTNAVFCEIDDLPMNEQHELFDNCELEPSIRVETRKSVHAYWLLESPLSVTQWERIQYGLIDRFKSDAGIKNENRLMRLPFFNHLTFRDGEFEAVRVKLHTLEPGSRFTFSQLIEAFPYTMPEPIEAKRFNDDYNRDTMEGIACELRYRISQLPSYRIRSDGKAEAQGVCHNGTHSKTAIFVNLRTGAVHCNAGCDFWKIAATFGLERPVKTEIRLRPRRQQTTATGKWLQEYVNAKEATRPENEAVSSYAV